MNSTMRKAKPTEYKGITFRSKSEAMFAYILDKRFSGLWLYEPYEVDDYLLDFSLIVRQQDNTYHEYLIEYKPSEPTETYLEWVFSKGPELRDIAFGNSISFMLVSLNMFDSDENAIEYYYDSSADHGYRQSHYGYRKSWADWARKARSYRFDLR